MSRAAAAAPSPITAESLAAGFDPLQVEMMQERLIVVDTNDKPLRDGSKLECHLVSPEGDIILHRAFSAFIFDQQGRLLLQKRASTKITFPEFWANTCCSHPLWVPNEMEEKDAMGVKRAAVRKLEHELGIPTTELDPNEFSYLTTFQYLALGEGGWGEHEIDHVIAMQVKGRELTVKPNTNEVDEVRWFTRQELTDFMANTKDHVSPWFRIIHDQFLGKWWECLEKTGSFESVAVLPNDPNKTIHRFHKLS